MKVLLSQFNHSGGEYLYRLAQALSKNHQVSVIATGRARDDSSLVESGERDFEISFLDRTESQAALLKRSLDPRTYLEIKRMVDAFDPDVVHVINEFFWNGALIPLLRKYPFFVTVHEPRFRGRHANRGLQTIYYRLRFPLNRLIRKHADGLFVHGPSTREILTSHIPSERIWTIPHGQYPSFAEQTTEDVSEETAVLFFGLIRDDKGLEQLIRAESKICDEIEGVTFLIAGQGELERYTSEIDVPERFEIHNDYLDERDASELFQRAAVVVCPYTDATQSGVIATAYPFGKPVIATTVGDVPTQIDHGRTGYLVPPSDPAALARRVVELLSNDEKRIRMGDAAREKARTDLSWDEIASITTTAYERTLSD